jgi:hypothetical protein
MATRILAAFVDARDALDHGCHLLVGQRRRQRTRFQVTRSSITTAGSTPCRRRPGQIREAGEGEDRGSTTFLAVLLPAADFCTAAAASHDILRSGSAWLESRSCASAFRVV